MMICKFPSRMIVNCQHGKYTIRYYPTKIYEKIYPKKISIWIHLPVGTKPLFAALKMDSDLKLQFRGGDLEAMAPTERLRFFRGWTSAKFIKGWFFWFFEAKIRKDHGKIDFEIPGKTDIFRICLHKIWEIEWNWDVFVAFSWFYFLFH